MRFMRFLPFAVIFSASALPVTPCFGQAAGSLAPIEMQVPGAVARAKRIAHAGPSKVLHISVSLPYGDPQGVLDYVNAVSNPKSLFYGLFLTPDEVGARFGQIGRAHV